jgi:DNA ligase (NAD+)
MGTHVINLMNAEVEQEGLTRELIEASRTYYTGTPTLTDAEFDVSLRRLAELETLTGKILPGSPTRVVGSDITTDAAKVKHLTKMLSLDNKFTVSDIVNFCPEDELIDEPKLDGLSLSLTYDNGVLEVAKTRGDGTYGEDVTANARVIAGIPLTVATQQRFEVRGEVVMTRSQLVKLNALREAEGDAPMANCRNAAAGSIKQRSPAECARRGLRFISYWTNFDPSTCSLTNTTDTPYLHTVRVDALDILGFHSIHNLFNLFSSHIIRVGAYRQSDVEYSLKELEAARKRLDIDLDGGVFKVNDTRRYAELGEGSKSPKWATAFKFPPEKVVARLESIIVQIGRTGQVTPVARISPTKVGGVTVTSASLMNKDQWELRGSPAPGDEVLVQRSAEVIPELSSYPNGKIYACPRCGFVGNLQEQEKHHRICNSELVELIPNTWSWPTHCPECGTEFVRDGVHFFDPNPDCPQRVKAYLKHVTCKQTLDWDGMGDKAVERLYKAGFRTLADLFNMPLSGVFSGAELTKLQAERERVKTVPLWRKLRALGAEDVGTTHSKTMAQAYGSLAAIIEAAETPEGDVRTGQAPATSNLAALIGPVCAQSFYARIEQLSSDSADFFGTLTEHGFLFEEAASDGPKPLAGFTFCLTGTLSTSGRDEMIAKIETLGGVVKSSCGKATTHLIVGESPGGTKTAAAIKFGTTVIDEAQLYALMGETMPSPAESVLPTDPYDV